MINCTIYQLEEGDCVEFNKEEDCSGEKRDVAVNVRKRYSSIGDTTVNNVFSGINPKVNLTSYNEDERKIIKVLGKALYVTNGGEQITVGKSVYRYILVKPTQDFTVMFNMIREVPVIFSDYISFEPRSLDVASEVANLVKAKLRLDRSCQILISNDSNIEVRITELLKDSNLISIVIPFSYREMLSGDVTADKIKERFRKYLFDADLFSVSKPIHNDVFFFGRRDYARDIADKCKRVSHCGIFGLRRSGKTSMLLAVQRILEQEKYPVVFIPCQSELMSLNWMEALYQLIRDIQKVLKCKGTHLHKGIEYKKESSNIAFIDDLNIMLEEQLKPIVLMFDEIEAITFGVTSSGISWREGDSYIQFWNILRGYCTQHPSRLAIVIAGTNPMINEISALGENQIPNPMFGQLAVSNQGAYLKPFDVESTKVMINTLGGYMGMKFADNIAAALTDNCGGHPYLIRLLCGQISKYVRDKKLQRPITISKGIYEKVLSEFEKGSDAEGFYLMILNILQSYYIKEYNALKILATEGDGQLVQTMDNIALQHLYGYGLIENNGGNLTICFDTIKHFLQGKYKFERKNLSIKEQKLEISVRFDAAEQKLRAIVRNTLRTSLGNEGARTAFLKAMEGNKAVAEGGS